MRYVLVSPPDNGDRARPHARPRFLYAIATGEAALTDPRALAAMAASVNCDLILCERRPSDSVLSACSARDMLIAAPAGSMADSALSTPAVLSMARFSRTPESFDAREGWAAAAARAIRRARRAEYGGICLADATRLLDPANEALRWHLTCLCRRIVAAVDRVTVEGWSGSGTIPLRSDLYGVTLADLDIQWELMDGDRIAARGRAEGSDDPPSARFQAPSLGDPSHWTREPRLRLRFHRPTLAPARNVSPAGEADGDVLVVRRSQAPADRPSGAVQIGGVGREIARIEVPLQILPPLKCDLKVKPVLGRYPAGAVITTALHNHTPAPLDADLRLTLRPAGGRPRAIDGSRHLLAGGQSAAMTSHLAADALAPGSNYVLAGVQSPAGVALGARLLYRNDGPGRLIHFRNTRVDPVRFWHWDRPEKPPLRVQLEGWEESAIGSVGESGRGGDWARGSMGEWASERVGEWASERVGEWESGRLGEWESGRLGEWESGRLGEWETGKVGCWRLGDNMEAPQEICEWVAGSEGVRTCRASWRAIGPSGSLEDGASVTADRYPDGLIRAVWRWNERHGVGRRVLWLPLPDSWLKIDWRRRALWDTYPRSHPDAPRGSLTAPLALSEVECVVISGDGAGMALLAGRDRLNVRIIPGALEIEPARARHSAALEFGIYPVQKPEEAEDLWLQRPPHVHQLSRTV